jgi:cytochrome c-type biogenesis protein CcmH/NrfG
MKQKTNLAFKFLLVFSISVVSGSAQITGGLNETTNTNLGGNNFIAGTVFWNSGKPVEERLRIRLIPMAGGEIIANTDENGKFVFSRVGEGSYTIVVDGDKEFATVTRVVEIERSRNPMPQTYSVSIRLNDRRPPENKPAVVKAGPPPVPKPALDLYENARKLSAAKDHTGAIDQLKLAVAAYPEYVDAYNELGVQYMRLNALEKAVDALVAALKIKADAFEPLLNHGISLFRLKRYDQAERQLRHSISENKDSAVAHYYLGRSLTSTGRFDEAEKELNDAVRLGGSDMNEAYRMLANLFLAKGDDKRAIDALELYLKLVPKAPDAEKLRNIVLELRSPR